MKILFYFFLITLFLSGCGKNVYLYKTENFRIDKTNSVYISPNDSVKCTSYYRPTMNIQDIDYYAETVQRELPLESLLRQNFTEHQIPLSKTLSDADVKITYQDYWFCRRKQSFLNLVILVEKQSDTTQKALVVLKAMSRGMGVDYAAESNSMIESLYNNTNKAYTKSQKELSDFSKVKDIPNYQNFQIGLSGGLSIGAVPHKNELKRYEDYYSRMKTAVTTLGVDLEYYTQNFSGFGLKAQYSFGQNSDNNIDQFDAGNNIIGKGKMQDNFNYLFIGPSYIVRSPFFNYDVLGVVKIVPGFLRYKNQAERFEQSFSYSKSSFAVILSAGVDFKLSKHFSLGIEPRLMLAGFNNMKINGEVKSLEERESLSRAEFCLSFKMNK